MKSASANDSCIVIPANDSRIVIPAQAGIQCFFRHSGFRLAPE